MLAKDLTWKDIKYFNREEFPENCLQYLDSRVILALDRFRDNLGYSIYPTPIYEGFVRHSGSKSSKHYVGDVMKPSRLSTAGDVFPTGHPLDTWNVAVNLEILGGVGIYLDTEFQGKFWPMFHVDLRARSGGRQLWWARVDGDYFYPINGGNEREEFFKALRSLCHE